MRKLLVLAAIAVTAFAVAPSPAHATTFCTGSMIFATVNDQLVVPPGATCQLTFVTVNGSVSVGPGAQLTAVFTDIFGGFGSLRAQSIDLTFVTVSSNAVIDRTSGAVSSVFTDFGASLVLTSNIGGVSLIFDTVAKDLTCFANSPPPSVVGTTVGGTTRGQC